MALDIKFAYVCRKNFSELQGGSELKRYCDSCRLEVINLDPLDDRARLEIFERAAASPERLCRRNRAGRECALLLDYASAPSPHGGPAQDAAARKIASLVVLFLLLFVLVGLYVIGKFLLGSDDEIDIGRAVGLTAGSVLLVFILGWIIYQIDQRVDPKPKQ
jgi:hypothetical protein